MAPKRASTDASDSGAGVKRGRKSLADSVDVTAVMSSEGPIVTVVMLRVDGSMEEIVLDMSPKLQLVAKEIGGSVSFLGQWEMLEVVLVIRGDQDDEKVAINSHKLQPPFHDASVRGDIMLMRNDEEGIPVDFTLKEYQTFQQLVIEEWQPADGNGDVNDEEESCEDDDEEEDDEEGDEEDDDDEEGDEGDEDDEDDGLAALFEIFLEKELVLFRTVNSREPTEEEVKVITETATTMAEDASKTMLENGEETDEEGGPSMEEFVEEIYGRLVQKFETDHNRPPTEEEVGPLREQAVKYAEQIIDQQGGDEEEDEDDEEDDEEEGEGEEEEEEGDEGADGTEEPDEESVIEKETSA